MKIGALHVTPVNDGYLAAGIRFSKPLPPEASLEPHCAMFREDGMVECPIGCFVVRSGDRVLLIDAGGGRVDMSPDGHPHPGSEAIHGLLQERGHSADQIADFLKNFGRLDVHTGSLPDDLARSGIRPGDITDVLFTHLHWDHIGWATETGRPYFPNATYRAPRADLDHFHGTPHERLNSALFGCPLVAEMLAPVSNRLEPWDCDTTIAPGVSVRVVPGHTPGNSVVVLHSEDQRAMLLGDVVHCPLELMDDDFNILGDFDQQLANKVREAFSRELEGSSTLVSASHFPGAHFGRLLAGKGMRGWLPLT